MDHVARAREEGDRNGCGHDALHVAKLRQRNRVAHMQRQEQKTPRRHENLKRLTAVKDLNKKRVQAVPFAVHHFRNYAGTPLIKPENLFKQTEPPLLEDF